MASQSGAAKFAAVALNPSGQNLDAIHKIVTTILARGGCGKCGRAAYLRVDFLGDPPPELAKEGVISLIEQGLKAG